MDLAGSFGPDQTAPISAPPQSQPMRLTFFPLCFLVFAVALATQAGDTGRLAGNRAAAEEPGDLRPIGRQTLKTWVNQLGDDDYHRREIAESRLTEAGRDAVGPLLEGLASGDLEIVERAGSILTEIAMESPPSDDGGVWESLRRIATGGIGRIASRAQTAVDEIRRERGRRARDELTRSGARIKFGKFVISSIDADREIVQVDDAWDAPSSQLQWFEWLDGIECARLQGTAVNADMLDAVGRMPDLTALELNEAKADDDLIAALSRLKPIHSLEIRYVPLPASAGDVLTKMPIRKSLSLMGTDVPAEVVQRIREATPGLEIEYKQGGFLGVRGYDHQAPCEITDVVPGSAAHRAGLARRDVITRIDDLEVKDFKDLRRGINSHLPGDEVEIEFRRGEVTRTIKLKLQKQKEF